MFSKTNLNLNSILWNDATVYKFYEGKYILLYYDLLWKVNKHVKLYEKYILNNINFKLLSKSQKYYFFIVRDKYSKFITCDHNILIYHINLSMDQFYDNNLFIPLQKEVFPNFNVLENNVNLLSDRDLNIKKITIKGFIILYNNELYKLKSKTYTKIKNMISYKNQYIGYLHLYQKNTLSFYSQFLRFSEETLINDSIKTLELDLLQLYYSTKLKKDFLTYDNLSLHYKKILFNIHGIYIQNKNAININQSFIHDYLKKISLNDLILLFVEKSFSCVYVNNLIKKIKN